MKVYALIAALFVAGLTASLGLGATRDHNDGTTSTSTSTSTSTTPVHPHCQAVALGGPASAGSVAFTAAHTSHNAAKLAGTSVTLTIPSGARVMAVACTDANGALTLRSLRVVNHVAGPKHEGHDKPPHH